MGREAECLCQWGAESATVKALLETSELILRSKEGAAIRRRVPFAEMQRVEAQGEAFVFTYEGEQVRLMVGTEIATKWAKALQSPPVALAKKLGITPDSIVWKLGGATDAELETALKTAKHTRRSQADEVTLIVALVNTKADLIRALETTSEQVRKGAPLWLIYPKGKGHDLTESDARTTALATGIVDNKVASISAVHTGLRLVKRREK